MRFQSCGFKVFANLPVIIVIIDMDYPSDYSNGLNIFVFVNYLSNIVTVKTIINSSIAKYVHDERSYRVTLQQTLIQF